MYPHLNAELVFLKIGIIVNLNTKGIFDYIKGLMLNILRCNDIVVISFKSSCLLALCTKIFIVKIISWICFRILEWVEGVGMYTEKSLAMIS